MPPLPRVNPVSLKYEAAHNNQQQPNWRDLAVKNLLAVFKIIQGVQTTEEDITAATKILSLLQTIEHSKDDDSQSTLHCAIRANNPNASEQIVKDELRKFLETLSNECHEIKDCSRVDNENIHSLAELIFFKEDSDDSIDLPRTISAINDLSKENLDCDETTPVDAQTLSERDVQLAIIELCSAASKGDVEKIMASLKRGTGDWLASDGVIVKNKVLHFNLNNNVDSDSRGKISKMLYDAGADIDAKVLGEKSIKDFLIENKKEHIITEYIKSIAEKFICQVYNNNPQKIEAHYLVAKAFANNVLKKDEISRVELKEKLIEAIKLDCIVAVKTIINFSNEEKGLIGIKICKDLLDVSVDNNRRAIIELLTPAVLESQKINEYAMEMIKAARQGNMKRLNELREKGVGDFWDSHQIKVKNQALFYALKDIDDTKTRIGIYKVLLNCAAEVDGLIYDENDKKYKNMGTALDECKCTGRAFDDGLTLLASRCGEEIKESSLKICLSARNGSLKSLSDINRISPADWRNLKNDLGFKTIDYVLYFSVKNIENEKIRHQVINELFDSGATPDGNILQEILDGNTFRNRSVLDILKLNVFSCQKEADELIFLFQKYQVKEAADKIYEKLLKKPPEWNYLAEKLEEIVNIVPPDLQKDLESFQSRIKVDRNSIDYTDKEKLFEYCEEIRAEPDVEKQKETIEKLRNLIVKLLSKP